MNMEYKHLKIEIKALDEKGMFEGYAAVKGNVDTYGDIIEDGAFEETISNNRTLPILFMHDPAKPVGLSKFMKEDQHGLYVCGQLDLDTELGRTTYSGLKKGYIDCMSIGYTVAHDDMNKKGNRLLKKINLMEYSLITKNFAANELAMVSGFKALKNKEEQYMSYYSESTPSTHDWNVPGLEEDMKRIKEEHKHMKRKMNEMMDHHEEHKRRHDRLREDHEELKRRHRRMHEHMKDMMERMSQYNRDHADDWEYYDGEYGYDVENIFDIEPPGGGGGRRERGKSQRPFFLADEADIHNLEVKAVGGSTDLPLAPPDHPWNGPAAKKRIFEWAGGQKFDPKKARKAFFYYDEKKPEERTAYKLPFADVIDGKLHCVRRAIYAVEGALNGARGTGVDIPSEDKTQIAKKVNVYKKRWEKEQPGKSLEDVDTKVQEIANYFVKQKGE